MFGGATMMGRRLAEAMMESTVVITRKSGVSRDESSGVETPTYDTIWSGPCRLRFPFVRPSEQEAVSQVFTEQRGILSVPVVGTEGIQTNDIATITVSPLDAGMLSHTYRVMGPFDETHATARRLPVQVVS